MRALIMMTLLSCLVVCVGPQTAAQPGSPPQPQPQTRDARPEDPVAGTARLSGMVVDTDPQPHPVRRVIVTLSGPDLAGVRSAISDDDGQFHFERLPAGRFNLTGTKAGFLTAAYGSASPGRVGVPLQIAAGQQVSGITLVIAHGAAIGGTVRDESGEPVSNLQVCAFRIPPPGAPPTLLTAGMAMTDDRGVYRVYGLMSGDYVVSSIRSGQALSDISAPSEAAIDAALRDLEQHIRSAAPSEANAPGTLAFAPVFYPGVPSPNEAGRIRLAPGDDRGDVDFTLRFTRMATVAGTLPADDGTHGVVFLINHDGLQLPSLVGSTPTFSQEVGPSGTTFNYTNVTPGRYTITATTRGPGIRWGQTRVEVTGSDVSGLQILLEPGLTFGGRAVFDGALPGANTAGVTLGLTSTSGLGSSRTGTTNMGNVFVPPVAINPDGKFEIPDIVADTYTLAATMPATAASWWLRSAIVKGVDVLDHPVDMKAGTSINDAQLTFSDKHTALSGSLETAAGARAPAYFVVVFPADRTLWRPKARRIALIRVGTDGRWIVSNLPPGDYLVAALTDIDETEIGDPAFLEQLATAAVKLTLVDGEQKIQNLRLGGL